MAKLLKWQYVVLEREAKMNMAELLDAILNLSVDDGRAQWESEYLIVRLAERILRGEVTDSLEQMEQYRQEHRGNGIIGKATWAVIDEIIQPPATTGEITPAKLKALGFTEVMHPEPSGMTWPEYYMSLSGEKLEPGKLPQEFLSARFDIVHADLFREVLGRSFMVYLVHLTSNGFYSAALPSIDTMEALFRLRDLLYLKMNQEDANKKLRGWLIKNDPGLIRLN
jgi:hypothetical protein